MVVAIGDVGGTQTSFSLSSLSERGARNVPQREPRLCGLNESVEGLLESRSCTFVSLKDAAGLERGGGSRERSEPRMSGEVREGEPTLSINS